MIQVSSWAGVSVTRAIICVSSASSRLGEAILLKGIPSPTKSAKHCTLAEKLTFLHRISSGVDLRRTGKYAYDKAEVLSAGCLDDCFKKNDRYTPVYVPLGFQALRIIRASVGFLLTKLIDALLFVITGFTINIICAKLTPPR
jgi:hypothetical protein